MEAVARARRLILAAKIPFSRPEGYFCEMIKTEEHMNKISKKISAEKEAAKSAEDARKQRINRKYGKKIQMEREQEKQQKRSEETKKLNMMRKKKRAVEKDDFDVEVEAEAEGKPSRNGRGPLNKRSRTEKPISAKRQSRNEKYGSGGKKRDVKRNTKESAGEDTFNVQANKRLFSGMAHRTKKTAGGKVQRPGKQRRQQIRGKSFSKK